MKRYRHQDWLRLGRAVQAARVREGLGDMKEWSGEVGRTDRMLYGLERGESVGARTLALIEDALGWDAGSSYQILEGQAEEPAPPPQPDLGAVSDDELLAEVARRIKRGGERGGDTAPTSGSSVTVEATEDEEGNGTAVAHSRNRHPQ